MNNSTTSVRIAIFSIGILMMGVVGIAGGLAEIARHFPEISQTRIQLLITLPSIVIIVVNPIIGKLQEFLSMKSLVLVGILCFLVGGVVPAFLESFSAVLVCRAILGIGIGAAQVLSTALVAEYFSGDERTKVMGQLSSAQMLGCAFMLFASGHLAAIGWNITFYLHSIALLSLICTAIFLPYKAPSRTASLEDKSAKPRLTLAAVGWTLTTFLLFINAMILANYLAFFMNDQQLGTAAEAGLATMLFAIGGFFMGVPYGKLHSKAGDVTMSIGFLLGTIADLIIAFAPSIYLLYFGCFLYGGAITIIFASIMLGTSFSVKPVAVPLAMSIVVMGQNLGSFLCPYIIAPLAGLMSPEINKYAFVCGAIWFAVMGSMALLWGMAKNAKRNGIAIVS